LIRENWLVPASHPTPDGELIPLRAGEVLPWQVATDAQNRPWAGDHP